VYGAPDEEVTSEMTYDKYVADLRDKTVEAFHDVHVSLQKSASRNKKYYDLGLKQQQFATGDWVLYFNPRKLRGKQMKWVRQFEGPFLIVSKPTSLTAKIQRSPKAQIRVAHIDKLKHFTGTPPKAWKVPDEVVGSSANSSSAMAGSNSAGQGSVETPPAVARDGHTDPSVVGSHIQFSTVEGSHPDVAATSGQSAVKDATPPIGIETPTGVRKGVRSRGRKWSVQPMAMTEFARRDSEKFSAPRGAQERSGNLLSPKVAMEGDKGPVVQDDTGGVNCATSRVASGLGRHECGAALPSDNVNANADADRIGADRMADLQGDSMSSGIASSDCGSARNTAECRAAVGSDPDVMEQQTAAGDSRSSDTCAGFPSCDGMVNERPDHTEGAASPSSVMEEGATTPSPVIVGGAVPPIDIADDIVSARDRVRTRRLFYGARRDSVSSDKGDPSVMMDDFGYIYDERTDISDISCADDEFDNFTPDISGCTESQAIDNVSEVETRNASAGLRQDCIDLDGAVFDENCSQRPRRQLRRPPKYDDYTVDFGNSQYVRRISKSRLKVESHTDDMMNAMSVSIGYTTGANVANATASARRSAATRSSKTAHTVCATLDSMNGRVDATTTTAKVATKRNVVSMPMRKAPSKVATIVLGSEVNAQLGK